MHHIPSYSTPNTMPTPYSLATTYGLAIPHSGLDTSYLMTTPYNLATPYKMGALKLSNITWLHLSFGNLIVLDYTIKKVNFLK